VSEPLPPHHPRYDEWCDARARLCDELSDVCDDVAQHVITADSLHLVPSPLLHTALRSATQRRSAVPVLLGSAYHNTGVQPLLDAVLNYLPGPLAAPPPQALLYGPGLCCLAFKVQHSKQYGGLLTFVRVYSGTLTKDSSVYNVNKGAGERPSRMYRALADRFEEVSRAGPGSIVVLAGLKKTRTGDTLVSDRESVTRARMRLKDRSKAKVSSSEPVRVEEEEEGEGLLKEEEEHLLVGVQVPEPVFFCSIEAAAPRFQKPLEDALETLQREDPSVTVSTSQETGQTVLGGAGELHLEVTAQRLRETYKLELDLGPLVVAYRETLLESVEHSYHLEKTIGESLQRVSVELEIAPTPGVEFRKVGLLLTPDTQEQLTSLPRPTLAAASAGAASALSSGPIAAAPIREVSVALRRLETGRGTAAAFVGAAVAACVRAALRAAPTALSEPVMALKVQTDEGYGAAVMADLNARRAEVTNVAMVRGSKHIAALVPLAELVGYSSAVRRLCSGRASFSLSLSAYRSLNAREQATALQRLRGF